MSVWRYALLLALFVFAGLSGAAAAPGKVALVIGNSNYAHVPKLTNPANDAADLAVALDEMGFDVTLKLDLDAQGMRRALQEFGRVATGSDTALIFFAGHGMEVSNQNYLIPTDARLATDRDVSFEAVPLDLVSDVLSGAKRLKLLLLDACRDNPFLPRMERTAGSHRSVGRGLAPVEAQGDTLIAYAAKGGTTASDGDGRNSPFTAALLRHIKAPQLDLRLLFGRVRDEVMEETHNAQEPFVYASLPGSYVYLVPPLAGDTIQVANVPGQGAAAGNAVPLGPSAAKQAWEAVQNTDSIAMLEVFLSEHTASLYAPYAKARIEELRAREAKPAEPTDVAGGPRGEPIPEPTPEPSFSVADVQRELQRVGCYSGRIDGDWGSKSRTALEAFSNAKGLNLGRDPSETVLSILQSASGTACSSTSNRSIDTGSGNSDPAPSGEWFVVLGSFPHAQRSDANDRAAWLRGLGYSPQVVDTDDYPGLRDGLYAVVLGPFSKSGAQSRLSDAQSAVSDAYIRKGY